jgi:short-subunit dehydrogenase/acyl-CoA synthetase (AMP-forming)/AMP-acid ligase II
VRRLIRIVAGIVGRGPRERTLRRAVAGRVVLVTGASEGIGAAAARRLAAAGAEVLLVARTAARLEQVRDEITTSGGTAHAYPCDLSSPEQAAALAAQLLRRHRRVDVVVSNAGHSIRRSVAETGDRYHDVQRTAAINYLGPVALLLGLLPAMRAAGRGHVVNVSTAGLASPAPYWSAYLASKSAFDVWLRCAAPELRVDGVTTSTVYCGLVRTRMSAPTTALRRVPAASPEEAAALVCRAVAHRPGNLWPWWARLAAVPATAFAGTVQRGFAVQLRLGRALSAAQVLWRSGLVRPAALVRTLRASRRYGATLAASFAAGPGAGLALVDADGPMSRADLDRAATDCAAHLTAQATASLAPTFARSAAPGLPAPAERASAGPAVLRMAGPVGLVGGARRDVVVAALALGRLGADTVLLSPDTPAAQLPSLLAAHGITVLIQDGRYPAPPVPSLTWPATPPAGVQPTRAGVARRGRARGRLTVLTSGSTGTPRAVRRALPVRVLLGPVSTHLRLIPLRAGRPILLAAPPHHGFGLAYLAAGLTLGAPVLLAGDLDPARALELAHEYRAEVLVGTPTQLRRLAASGTPVPGLRAVISGAAPLPDDLYARLVEVFGNVVYNLYGTTEAGWAALATPKDLAAAPGTVGRAPRGVRLRVRDRDGEQVPPGEVGEVFVAGWAPGGAEVATGDLGRLDPVGRLLLHGRVDAMAISGGVNVHPEPVAAVLAGHPDVAAVEVDTVPDAEYGQRLAARVRLRPGAELTEEQLRAWQRDRLSPAQRPRDLDLTTDPADG